MMSTRMLTATNVVATTSTPPITTGKSPCSKARNMSSPMPFHPNTYSTNTAPANMLANQPLAAVSTGFMALRNTWRRMSGHPPRPLARAVRT